MFDQISDSTDNDVRVDFIFDGKNLSVVPGTTVAAALLAAGQLHFRETPVSGQKRGPFCMMGACYDCLVQIDGVTVQACMTSITEGLEVHRVPKAISSKGDRS
ncbi:(2Fe-2S)-binding protein [Kiloniella sp.]|uniref:(2Fe-2S)-binding protein n=1 Tax=Kiloniella sp. TaxID=1938587 RepID=UPI003B024999